MTIVRLPVILTFMLNVRFWRVLTIMVAAGITVLSLLPRPPVMPVGIHLADKIAHFFAYLVLGFLVFASIFWGKNAGTILSTVFIVTALCLFYGGLIEILQTFTGRTPEFWDLAADLFGAVCGASICAGVWRHIRRKRA